MTLHHVFHPTPIGDLLLVGGDDGLHRVQFPNGKHGVGVEPAWSSTAHRVLDDARMQLDAYFDGTRRSFDLPLAPRGTPFQREVWTTLAAIPFGATWSYAQLASVVGKPKAMRAVGAANGRNPLPIVLPCHRVIGANGSLTGFGGGLPTKQFLLELEGALPRTSACPEDLFA